MDNAAAGDGALVATFPLPPFLAPPEEEVATAALGSLSVEGSERRSFSRPTLERRARWEIPCDDEDEKEGDNKEAAEDEGFGA